MMYRLFYLIVTVLLLQGCIGGYGFVYKDHLFGNYYLIGVDEEEQMSLSYHTPEDRDSYSGVIEEAVFAIGYNEKYVIVKQHPRKFPNPPDRKITNYFILPIKKGFDYWTMNGLAGPMTLEQFIEKRYELKIPDSLHFTKEFENLK
jgi:hypothetical protein